MDVRDFAEQMVINMVFITNARMENKILDEGGKHPASRFIAEPGAVVKTVCELFELCNDDRIKLLQIAYSGLKMGSFAEQVVGYLNSVEYFQND
jgi:hypothetical protein